MKRHDNEKRREENLFYFYFENSMFTLISIFRVYGIVVWWMIFHVGIEFTHRKILKVNLITIV